MIFLLVKKAKKSSYLRLLSQQFQCSSIYFMLQYKYAYKQTGA